MGLGMGLFDKSMWMDDNRNENENGRYSNGNRIGR